MQYDWNIIGHETQRLQLEAEIHNRNVAHAYLFSGPPETGKYRLASAFAMILQCENGLCRACKTCLAIVRGVHADTFLLKDDGESLKIDTLRDLIGKASLSAQSRYRIFVIENIERMPIEAQNSFLKTLEEPPGKTLFILTTSHINNVLPTILSRVRPYFFFNVPEAVLKEAIQRDFKGQAPIAEAINMAQGRPGLAIRLICDGEFLNRQRELYRTIERFLSADDLIAKFAFVENLIADEDDERSLERFYDAFTRYLRKVLFEYMETDAHPLQSRFSLSGLVNLFESLEKTRYLTSRNANKKLALENLLLQTEL